MKELGSVPSSIGCVPVKIQSVEMHVLVLPFKHPHATAFGTQHYRTVLLLRLLGENGLEGWGECLALSEPTFSAEYVNEVQLTVEQALAPILFSRDWCEPSEIAVAMAPVRGHQMAKATIEMALIDADLRRKGQSMADYLGAERTEVTCGASIGIKNAISDMLVDVEAALERGYRRIKLNIVTGRDLKYVTAIRKAFGSTLVLQVDANGSYSPEHADTFRDLEDHNLLLIEQPFPPDHLSAHIELASTLTTPLCLDESIGSAVLASDLIKMGACSVVNIKPGRIGGYLESLRVLDICLSSQTHAFIGGMYETALAKSANIALAAVRGATLPNDIVPTSQYFDRDISDPIELADGQLKVSQSPGVGPWPSPERLAELRSQEVRVVESS